ncbi:MAG: TonB-dependent receptor, partial [Chthoniobacteraceae bacterium]
MQIRISSSPDSKALAGAPRHPLLVTITAASLLLPIPALRAQNAAPFTLETVTVEAEGVPFIQEPFLPAVQDTKIYAGKKTSVIDLDAFPQITNNNYRQALAKTPGLYLSEETTPLVSLGYRGLDPNRVQFTQVLKDGIPIHADQFGYPEAYYTPPLDTVDRIEFLRGGAALMYGPQPGGALNYVTHRPRKDTQFAGGTTNVFGSGNLFSNFSYFSGTTGRLGYYGYFNHREGDNFRTANSGFDLNAAHLKLELDGSTNSRWILTLEGYKELHGEPGGLTFATGANRVNYDANRDAASRLYDRFELTRYSASLQWERDFSPETQLVSSLWGTYYQRYSERQRGGGFGVLPNGADVNTNTIENQKFYTFGFETRLRHDYDWLGGKHTFAGGLQVYHTDSPRVDERGARRDADTGAVRNDNDRWVTYLPVFFENKFTWGKFSITPGLRFENVWQGVTENVNVAKTAAGTPLAGESEFTFVPLIGLGLSYELAPKVELYGNISQSYRPKIYTQAVPTGGTAVIPTDLQDGLAWQYEAGFRGRPTPWLNWDASLFRLDFDNQIGTVALNGGRSTVGNVGRAIHQGAELAAEVDLIGLADSMRGNAPAEKPVKGQTAAPAIGSLGERYGALSLYANAMLLDAEFVSGPQEGRTPRYAADYLVRAGVIYRAPKERFRIAFTGTMVGDSFADDGNTAERYVPAYVVWDLTAEAKIYKDTLSVNAGINNLFNEDYYSR